MNLNSSQIDRLRHFNKHATNRLTMRFAGKHVYAVIYHQGRKSGKVYQTPVVAMPAGDGFVFPLPYSEHADWCRNVLAAGGCRMEWRGRWYSLQNPQLIEPSEALAFFPCWMHRLLRRTEIYLKLDKSPRQELPPGRAIQKILVYGAGVLGSLYAGKLHQAGYDVTLLTREERLTALRRDGLVLVDDGAEGSPAKEEHISLPVICKLAPDDIYDLVLVVVRKNQISSVLPALAANTGSPNILFLVNNAEGARPLVNALGHERVLLGFPGAGGRRTGNTVHYFLASSVQPTTIGELDGQHSARLAQVKQVFQDAGLPVAICDNMDAWLKTHVALVSPMANAIYLAGGSNYRLARTRDGVVLMVRAVKEGLRVLRALNIPLTPARYRVLGTPTLPTTR
jgi:2-dehydropantoate 2-reductase